MKLIFLHFLLFAGVLHFSFPRSGFSLCFFFLFTLCRWLVDRGQKSLFVGQFKWKSKALPRHFRAIALLSGRLRLTTSDYCCHNAPDYRRRYATDTYIGKPANQYARRRMRRMRPNFLCEFHACICVRVCVCL